MKIAKAKNVKSLEAVTHTHTHTHTHLKLGLNKGNKYKYDKKMSYKKVGRLFGMCDTS